MVKTRTMCLGMYLILMQALIAGLGVGQTGQQDRTAPVDVEKQQEEVRQQSPLHATDLMPLRKRSGYFLLKGAQWDVPKELPFSLRKTGDQRYVLEKENRVKHLLQKTDEGGVNLVGEIDLQDQREVSFEPPVTLLPATISSSGKQRGTSEVTVSGLKTDQVKDRGDCTWTLKFEGRKKITVLNTQYTTYRFRLKRAFDMGGIKHATVTVKFDYVPGKGQIRAEVNHDSRVFGLVGPNEEWVIERIPEVFPQKEVGTDVRDTIKVMVKRYTQVRSAFTEEEYEQAREMLNRILQASERIDISGKKGTTETRRKIKSKLQKLRIAIQETIDTSSLKQGRRKFRTVSDCFWRLLLEVGHGFDRPVRLLREPGKTEEHAHWIGLSGDVPSPYSTGWWGKERTGMPVRYLYGSREGRNPE